MALQPNQRRVLFVAPRSTRPAFQPTEEQQDIDAAALTGEDVAVTALAGSGKTTSLKMLARARPNKEMTYVAFNRAVADDAARTFPSNVTSRTAHSFAFRAVGKRYEDRLNGPRVPAWKAANILRIPERFEYGAFSLRSNQLARLVLEGVQRFCHSNSDSPSGSHIPRVPGLELPDVRAALVSMLESYVVSAWDDLTSPNGQLRFNPDVYLKIWAMGHPILPGDVILADEAQDFDPVIKQIVECQDAQKIYMGDSNQQVYSWRGSVDALSSFRTQHRLPLTRSFRFGPVIAEEANRILDLLCCDLRVVGHDPVDSKLAILTHPDCMLTRTNAEAIAQLMNAQVAGIYAGLVGGTAQVEALAQAALDLTQGRKTTHQELLAFETWQQVREYVAEEGDARELKVLVRLVDQHGADVLLDAVRRAVPESSAQLVISTAHKAKGREWSRVRLTNDFQDPFDEEEGDWDKGELRLAYVAVTRAKEFLDSAALGWIRRACENPAIERVFLNPDEVPERERVELAPIYTEQLIPDPEDATRLIFCRTQYDPALVAAQQRLSRSYFKAEYAGLSKVRVCLATRQAIEVAEWFGLTIAQAARDRVASMAG